MVPISKREGSREFLRLTRYDGEVWQITRDQVLAMLAAQPRGQVVSDIKDSIALFLEVSSQDIKNKILFDAAQTGEILGLTLINAEE